MVFLELIQFRLYYAWSNGQTTSTATGLAAGSHYCVVTDSVNGCSDTTFVTIAEPSAVSASITTQDATNPTTANGTATISVTGGTACVVAASLSSHNPSLSSNGSSGCHFNIENLTTSPITITDFSQGSYSYSGANTITVYSMPAPYDQTTTGGTWSQVGQATVTIPTGGSFPLQFTHSCSSFCAGNNTSRINIWFLCWRNYFCFLCDSNSSWSCRSFSS